MMMNSDDDKCENADRDKDDESYVNNNMMAAATMQSPLSINMIMLTITLTMTVPMTMHMMRDDGECTNDGLDSK